MLGWFGWHEISNPLSHLHGDTYGPNNKTGARDLYQVAERVNLWWSVYVLAQRVAFTSGSPDGCPDLPPEVTLISIPTISRPPADVCMFMLEDHHRLALLMALPK